MTSSEVTPCPHCGRGFAASPDPALRGLREATRQSHVDACKGPPLPTGRPTALPAETIERVESLYRGGMGLRAIARLLAEEGVPTAHGGQWRGGTVRALLLRARRDLGTGPER